MTLYPDPEERGKILLIDDEVTTRLILQKSLEDETYEVKVAINGKEGLKIANYFCPNLMVPYKRKWVKVSSSEMNI